MLVAKWEWWYHQNALAFKSHMRQNNLSHHSSPSSSFIYSSCSPHIVESDREISWLKVDCVLISVIVMHQDDTRWPPFQNNHLNTVLLSQTSHLSRSQYWCLLQNDSHGIIRMHWHLNHHETKQSFTSFLSFFFYIFSSSTHIVESDREILWLKVDCVLISVILMYQDDTRWPPFQNKHLNTVLLSQTSQLSGSQYWCLLQNNSHGIIRMHWHLNHVWDKTIFHIIPLLLLLLYIQLLVLILLKVIERYCDWKWIVFSFLWFKCTKMTLDDLPFKIIISIQSY